MNADLYDAANFEAFYERYLALHASREVRVAHAIATTSAAVVLGVALATRRPLLALAAPIVDYAIAQASHREEGRSTQPWRRPSWHLRAEGRLFRRTVGNGLIGACTARHHDPFGAPVRQWLHASRAQSHRFAVPCRLCALLRGAAGC